MVQKEHHHVYPREQPVFFNAEEYRHRIDHAASFIKERLPKDFVPKAVVTLGSGGLGAIAESMEKVATIPYGDIPGFFKPTVVGHAGNLIAGYIEGVPVIGYQGRRHYYEDGGQPNQVVALKDVVFPVYVARALGADLYIATNAAGGLNPAQKPGDLMTITSHIDIYFPNVLLGPQVDFMNAMRFQPQHGQYNKDLRALVNQAAHRVGEGNRVHQGVYAALTGPTFESNADSLLLRKNGADAVGMSTVPEIITASNIGMETLGISLISNVIAADGTNATSHEEVTAALEDPATRKRATSVLHEFFRLYAQTLASPQR
ncbi:purine-nucleoside phosphorylase [Candidatus Gottesmanbacteria bacterium]|nr:purine-nucleoside phosphorylase [Candidatus Gottesmanbacteria bacterium]